MGSSPDGDAGSLAKAAFDKYDSNGDGLISVDELERLLKSLGGTVADVKNILGQFNKACGGSLRFEEFFEWLSIDNARVRDLCYSQTPEEGGLTSVIEAGAAVPMPHLVHARLLSGEEVDADFSCAERVADARKALAQKLGVVPARLKLLHGDRELRDREELTCLLPDGAVLVVLLPQSIRMLCRIRPFSRREADMGDARAVHTVDERRVKIDVEADTKTFEFGAAFESGSQDEIFRFCKDTVTGAMSGSNGCIVAYGQTGAGKTYSMYGPSSEAAALGVVPRAAQEVFAATEGSKTLVDVKLSMIEIDSCTEELVDLLQEGPTAKLMVRIQKTGAVYVENATQVQCCNMVEFQDNLERAFRKRSVRNTAMRPPSTRSHLLAILTIASSDGQRGQSHIGKLVMADLCGSEVETRVLGAQLREAQSIRRSLSSLRNVLHALSKGARHVPWRDTKLTMLLKDCMASAILLVACSPAACNTDETLRSLAMSRVQM